MFIVYSKLTEKCVNDLILSYSAIACHKAIMTDVGDRASVVVAFSVFMGILCYVNFKIRFSNSLKRN